jgi:hypothetical protein
MSLSGGFNVQWSTPTDSTSSFVSSYRIVVYNNGTTATLPNPYIPNAASNLSTFFVPAAQNTICNIAFVGGTYLTVNNYYYATVQAMQSNNFNTFSSILVSSVNAGQYLIPPSPLSSLYMVNNSYMYFNWYTPDDSSFVSHVNVRLFSNATGTQDFNATPFCNVIVSTNSYCPLAMPVPGTWYYFTAQGFNGALGGPVASTIAAKQYVLFACSHTFGNPARNNRYPVDGPLANAGATPPISLYSSIVHRAKALSISNAGIGTVVFPSSVNTSNFYGGPVYPVGTRKAGDVNAAVGYTHIFKNINQRSRFIQYYNETTNQLTSGALDGTDIQDYWGTGFATDERQMIYMQNIDTTNNNNNRYVQIDCQTGGIAYYGGNRKWMSGDQQTEVNMFPLIGGDNYHYILNQNSAGVSVNPAASVAFLVLSNPGALNQINGGNQDLYTYYINSPSSALGNFGNNQWRTPQGPAVWSPQGYLVTRYEGKYQTGSLVVSSISTSFGTAVCAFKPNHKTRDSNCSVWTNYVPFPNNPNQYGGGVAVGFNNRVNIFMATQELIIVGSFDAGGTNWNNGGVPQNKTIVLWALNVHNGSNVWVANTGYNTFNTSLSYPNVVPPGGLLSDDTIVAHIPCGDPNDVHGSSSESRILFYNLSGTRTSDIQISAELSGPESRSFFPQILVDKNNNIFSLSYYGGGPLQLTITNGNTRTKRIAGYIKGQSNGDDVTGRTANLLLNSCFTWMVMDNNSTIRISGQGINSVTNGDSGYIQLR